MLGEQGEEIISLPSGSEKEKVQNNFKSNEQPVYLNIR
jgi:hypothetical protein